MTSRCDLLTGISVGLLYGLSLLLPVTSITFQFFGRTVQAHSPCLGFHAFLVGLDAPFRSEIQGEDLQLFAGWLANPVFWAGLYLLLTGRHRWSLAAGLVSLCLGLAVLPLVWNTVREWPAYWVWLGSFVGLLAGNLICVLVASSSQCTPNQKLKLTGAAFSGFET
jgi:hypothetical protein